LLTLAGWHFFYFSYKRWGWDDTNNAINSYSAFREFQFYVSRASDSDIDPDWYSYTESNVNERPSIYPLNPFTTPVVNPPVVPAPGIPAGPAVLSVNLGH
jgi:NADH:ubiquinone oxidoreductase subunit